MSEEIFIQRFTKLCAERKLLEAIDEFYSEEVVSLEPDSTFTGVIKTLGKVATREKNSEWIRCHEFKTFNVSTPMLGDEQFALTFYYDATDLRIRQRMRMSEVGLYSFKEGAITQVSFFYGPASS